MRLQKIKQVTLERPFIFSFFGIFFAYSIINILTNQLYVTGATIFSYNLFFLIPFIVLTLLVAVLTGISINLVWVKYREFKQVNKASGFTALGIFTGLLGGSCPGCFAGVFPAFLGLFGVSASLSSLPLYGLEIQLGSAILLVVAIFFLTKNPVCKV
jgi:hypothetical protein